MRVTLIAAICAVLAASAAQAERRMFIIANDAGQGIDKCLASGAACGATAASAYCHSHQFAEAKSFRKVDRDDITGAIPATANMCRGASCDEFVAIECAR